MLVWSASKSATINTRIWPSSQDVGWQHKAAARTWFSTIALKHSQQRQRWSHRETASILGKVRKFCECQSIPLLAKLPFLPHSLQLLQKAATFENQTRTRISLLGQLLKQKCKERERQCSLLKRIILGRPTNTVTKYKSFRVHMQFCRSGTNQKHLKIPGFHIKHVSGNS